MNNKGFMMAEVIVVSAVVMVTLVGLYTSYNKIFSLYNQRLNYYDVATLYELAFIRDNNIDSLVLDTKNDVGGDIIYYVSKDKVKDQTVDTSGLKKTFKDYLDYLSTSLDYNSMVINESVIKNLLIMENCSDENNCKYAYLEVLDNDAILAPKCSLSVSGTTITASVNIEDDRIVYAGWDENKISDNGIMTKTFDNVGTYTFYIKDNEENVGRCSVNISAYSSVDTETKNCSSSNWSNKNTACSSGYSYSTDGCSRSVSSYTEYYAWCVGANGGSGYVWQQDNANYRSGRSSCSVQVASGSACSHADYAGGSELVSRCVANYKYNGTITCRKYACNGNGYTRIENTDYCYKIN